MRQGRAVMRGVARKNGPAASATADAERIRFKPSLRRLRRPEPEAVAFGARDDPFFILFEQQPVVHELLRRMRDLLHVLFRVW
jgi:hypothetical protein